ncbi:MAG: hypothetical protein ABUT39_25905 [Acidobacteriota bacterium]
MAEESLDLFVLSSWKKSLEILEGSYSRYISGAMGGILTIVATIGLSFDKLQQMGWIEKILICGALILLILAVGNLLNCVVFAVNSQLELLQMERAYRLNANAAPSTDELRQLDATLTQGHAVAQRFFAQGYWCIVLAVILAIAGFFTILVRFS